MSIEHRLEQALAAHRHGRLADAEQLCASVLADSPQHGPALHLLGVICAQTGRLDHAATLITRAVALMPGHAAALADLANVHSHLGNATAALDCLGRAAVLQPRDPGIAFGQARLLADLGRAAEALVAFERVLALAPDAPPAHHGRANALADLGRPAEALAAYDRAVALAPDLAEAWIDRGVALGRHGQPEAALASYERAIALRPGDAIALCNRGAVLHELRRHHEALADFDRAVAARPDFAAAHAARALALAALGQRESALAAFDRALAFDPGQADAQFNRASVLLQLKRFAEAARGFERALSARPGMAFAAGYRAFALMQAASWSELDTAFSAIEAGVGIGAPVVAPFPYLAMRSTSGAQLACARIYAQHKYPAAPPAAPALTRAPSRRVRVAYVSADFRDHPVARLVAELFEVHDRSRFELFGCSLQPAAPGGVGARIRQAFENFREVAAEDDTSVAAGLRAQAVDIAVDLNGYTDNCRPGIFANRAAAVQVSWLGYPGTLGTPYHDYIVADATVIPPGDERAYAECVVRLPDCYQANDRKRAASSQTPSRAQAGLPERGFVFCCFNNSFKITPQVFAVWIRLLRQIDGSVLWLLEDSAEAAANLRAASTASGIAANRLVFAPRLELEQHLARHRLADLFLDTLPYTAHTTCSDALWVGLPVLTCQGATFAGRVAASLLRAARLPELITGSLAEYEAAAMRLARDPERVGAFRAHLTRQGSSLPLFDTDRFRRHLESAFLAMHERARQGLPAAGFDVAPFD